VFRNDAITCDQLRDMQPAAILVSPGPGRPDSAGVSLDSIRHFADNIPLLGVCLGHQSIGQHFGASIVQAQQIMHGKLSDVYHNGKGVFSGLPSPLLATRYHSLVIDKATLPDELEVTDWTLDANGEIEEIMGVRHRQFTVEGVQFHPESVSSEHGHAMLADFLKRAKVL